MCNIENLESIKKYICDEIMKFKPKPTKGNYLNQLETFMNDLINEHFISIICLYSRALALKQQTIEYEETIKELKNKIPDIQI